MSKLIEFPSGVDRLLKQITTEIHKQENLSQFQREELATRVPLALKPLVNAQVRVEIPEGIAVPSEALASIVQQVRDQFELIFVDCLIKSLKRHVQLIEDLRKQGVKVETTDK